MSGSRSSYFTDLAKKQNHVVLDTVFFANPNKVEAYLKAISPGGQTQTYLPDAGIPAVQDVYGIWKTITQSSGEFDLGTLGPPDPSVMPAWGVFTILGYTDPDSSPYGDSTQGYVVASIPCVVTWGFSNS